MCAPKICVVKVANLKSCMLLAKLSCGMGHNSYGEAAWPNDIVYIFAVLIYGLGVLIFGLSIACPLEIMSCSNAFSTPLEIVPEWYLLLCFNLLRIVTSKGIGVKEMVILVPITIFLCIIENVSVYSNPFRRAIMVCVTLVYSIFAIWLSVGSLVRIDKALPLLWMILFSLRSHACEPHVAGHASVMTCYVPQTSEAKRSDTFIFGSEADPTRRVVSRAAERSGECASKKEITHPQGALTCTRNARAARSHMHPEGAWNSRTPQVCTHTHAPEA